MGLKCGIVGLPNVGKSTLFNCISSSKAQAANFPFCTIEPNVGVTNVPDARLAELEKIVKPERVLPATVEIVDIAGLVKGASKGEGLGNQFLANIRETDAILHVLRCFDDENIIHVDGNINPIRDKEVIDYELLLKDLDSVEKRIPRVEKLAKVGADKEAKKEYEGLVKLKAHFEQGLAGRSCALTADEAEAVATLQLLTMKPVLYVCNVNETDVKTGNAYTTLVGEMAAKEGAQHVLITAAMESEIAALESYEDRVAFLAEIGLDEPGVNKLVSTAYGLLNLQTYFTAGVKEVRAWTINKGDTAPRAAAAIHTDFERGFIKAEVIGYDDYLKYGSEQACKEAGRMRMEGKEYIVADGDVIHFKFNV